MNDIVAKAAICVGGFLAMFLPLYLFADPGISPFYDGAETRVALVATNTRNDATDFRNDAEETDNDLAKEVADVEGVREASSTFEISGYAPEIAPQVTKENETSKEGLETYQYESEELASDFGISDAVQEAFGDNGKYEIHEDRDGIVIDFWDLGIDEDIQRSIDGSLNSQAYLFGVESVYVALCRAIWEEIEVSGSDKHITVNLWDVNHENLFFSISDGSREVYDITRTADFNIDNDEKTPKESESPQISQGGTGGNSENFWLYYNPDQPDATTKYVLNTDSKVIHHFYCSDVDRMKPENKFPTDMSISEIMEWDDGYRLCGHEKWPDAW